MGIGFVDMVATAWLHAQGKIVEMNPLMRGFLAQGEWMFVFVKSLTLVAAWIVMARYATSNLEFVRRTCIWGSIVYASVWTVWFLVGSFA
jgi:hypothetical protein